MKTFLTLSTVVIFLSFSSCQSGSSATSDTTVPGDTLTVMTYNIHHANPPETKEGVIKIDSIATVIKKVNPDLVALQEIDVNTKRSGTALNEAKRLAELTGMYSFFVKTLDYDGGAYGIAVLSRFPIKDSVGYLLPKEPGTNEETRGLCLIKIELPGGQPLYFASTHLGLSKNTRLMQADSIINVLSRLSAPLIIGGDFNAEPGSETINKFVAVLKRSCTTNCEPTIPYDHPREKIDFLFYKGNGLLNPIQLKVLNGVKWSDHLPVVAHFKYVSNN